MTKRDTRLTATPRASSRLISSRIWAWMVTSSAVVGSSAISRAGWAGERHRDHDPLAHAAVELVRELAGARGPGSAMPTRDYQLHRRPRGRLAAASMTRWISRGAVSCSPAGEHGLRLVVIGDWKSWPISGAAETRAARRRGAPRRSRRRRRARPPSTRAAGTPSRRQIASAETRLARAASRRRARPSRPCGRSTTRRPPRGRLRLGMELGAETPDVEEDLHQAASLPHRPRRSAGAPAGSAPRHPAGRCGTYRSPASGPIRALAGTTRALRRRAVGEALGVDRPRPASGCGRRPPRPRRQALLDVARLEAAARGGRAHTPARQSACSSSRTDSALAPVGARLLRLAPARRAQQVWTWWPNSWAIT